jgi:DNA invertase Pin-like site-specific DNA recombinase
MNAVIYARYSSHSQRDESIEGQLRECHEYAAKNGFTVVGEYCDRAISGKTDNRPMFQKLIRDSEKGRFQAVIMYTLDRFARNRYDSAIYKAKLKKNGIKLHYAKQPMPDTPEGIILESVLEGYAEYYSENLSRSIKRGLKENALQCLATGGASVPMGYCVGEDKRFKIDPVEAKIVREVFQLYADGLTVSQIIAYCNERGYKTSRGREFNKNSLRTMLTNEKYAGTYKFMDVVIPDGMPAIVDKALFDKVQEMRAHNAKIHAKSKAHEEYLLTTKVFCGHCGAMLVGESGTARSGKMHYYYKCANRKRNHNCTKKVEKKDWLEETVVRYTVTHMLTDENIERIANKTMELIEKEASDNSYLLGLEAELSEVQDKLDNIMKAIEAGIITKGTKERLEALEAEKEELEDQIAREEIKKPSLTKEHIVYWLQSFKNGDIDDINFRRKVINALVNAIYVYDDGDKGRKIVFTFNVSGENRATVSYSDIEALAPPIKSYPNHTLHASDWFGYIAKFEGVS